MHLQELFDLTLGHMKNCTLHHVTHVPRSTITFGTYLKSLSHKIEHMTLALTVFKKSSFQKKSHLNALGSKFDLDIK